MTSRRTGEPTLTTWAVLIASFALSAATWVALAQLAGFTQTIGLFRLAWLMPVAVDGYVVVSLVTWMAPVPEKVAQFAKKNTYAAATVGVAAQSSYHALTTYTGSGGVIWRTVLAAVVGMIPPAVAALSVHMRALTRRTSEDTAPATQVAAPAATSNEPGQAVAAPPAPPVLAAVEPPTRTVEPRTDETSRDRTERAGTPAPEPIDEQVIRALLQHPTYVPREPDGTVPIRRASTLLKIGPGRAKRLLGEEGLLRTGGGEQAATDDVPAGVDEDATDETRELEGSNA